MTGDLSSIQPVKMPDPATPNAAEPRSNNDIAPCLALIVPVYNEVQTVEEILQTVLAQRPVQEVIVVNDASTDGTWDVLEKVAKTDPRIRLINCEVNEGKGAAIYKGMRQATAPYVLIQDADLEYDPTEYHMLLRPL